MEVAVLEEKKIFRARKTMKMSDRQQLEVLHNTLNTANSSTPSSPPQTPLVNGTHTEKEPVKEDDLNRKEEDLMAPASDSAQCSPSPSLPGSRSPSPSNTQTTSPTMDMDDPLVAAEKKDSSNKSSSSSVPASPSGLNCDPEVKEGFLCLSEEDEKDGDEEEMNVEGEKEDQEDKAEEQTDNKDGEAGNCASTGTKRSLSEDANESDKEIEERDGKRPRLDGEELEAQLELKITTEGGNRHKLEKMVQKLVEERLRVLQLTVFDQSLKELKERVEKIDNATKQQNALHQINSLQAKISRLSKKFGAANQASENAKRKQEAAAQANNANTATPQRTVKTTVESKLSTSTAGSNATVTPAQPKPLSTPATSTTSALASPAPILQIISTNASGTSSSSSLPGQPQTSTILLKTGPGTGVMTSTPATSGGQPMSIQPLLIQLPLTMANGQSGALVNTSGGVGLIPVSSLSTVNSINKAKTTTPSTTFILQKTAGTVVSSTSSAPAVSLARAVFTGGTGTVSSPSTGISVTTARTPIQSAAIVGVTTAASSPGTTGPAATGSAAAAAGSPSASASATKTENQAATPKTPSQPGRPKGSVIDLTEDDDDVQVTGVQKATVSPMATQRSSVLPPLVSSTPNSGTRATQKTSVDTPSATRPSSSSLSNLPPLPSAPSPQGRLPPEAAQTSLPQQPQLKLARVQSQNGIVLSWCVAETDRNCAAVDTYHLYAYHQDHQGPVSSTGAAAQALWKKIGEVKALPLPMACTLTQFVSGSTYYFAVRAKDIYGRFGPFCEPQCTDVITPATTASS